MKFISTKLGERQFEVISSSEVSDAWNVLVYICQKQDNKLLVNKKHLMSQQVEKILSNGS